MAYTAMNLQPMGKQILSRGGSTDGASMQSYAQTAGAIGGAAICAASGAGAAASAICAQVGGAIVRVIAGSIGSPATAGNAYGLYDLWSGVMVPSTRMAQEGSLAVRAYLTVRDQLIDDLSAALKPIQSLSAARSWADQRLTQLGLPGAPILPEWAPRADLWQAYFDNAVWSKNPVGDPPTWLSSMSKQLYPNKNFCSYGEIWGYESPSINALSAKVGLSCSDLLLLQFYPMGAPAPMGEPINWAMVGAWELAQRATAPYASIPRHSSNVLRVARPGVQVPQLPAKSPQPVVVARVTPSQHATGLLLKLQEATALLQAEVAAKLKQVGVAKVFAELQAQKAKLATSDRKLMIAGGVLALAGAGALVYHFHKRRA